MRSRRSGVASTSSGDSRRRSWCIRCDRDGRGVASTLIRATPVMILRRRSPKDQGSNDPKVFSRNALRRLFVGGARASGRCATGLRASVHAHRRRHRAASSRFTSVRLAPNRAPNGPPRGAPAWGSLPVAGGGVEKLSRGVATSAERADFDPPRRLNRRMPASPGFEPTRHAIRRSLPEAHLVANFGGRRPHRRGPTGRLPRGSAAARELPRPPHPPRGLALARQSPPLARAFSEDSGLSSSKHQRIALRRYRRASAAPYPREQDERPPLEAEAVVSGDPPRSRPPLRGIKLEHVKVEPDQAQRARFIGRQVSRRQERPERREGFGIRRVPGTPPSNASTTSGPP